MSKQGDVSGFTARLEIYHKYEFAAKVFAAKRESAHNNSLTSAEKKEDAMLTVSGKAIGRKKPLFDDFSVPPPTELDDGSTTLRDLIECIVRHEITAFKQRQADRQFIRALTAREIAAGVEAGKIESGGSEVAPQPVDEDAAVATALQAFEDGMYLVVVDGEEQRQLDRQIFLQPDSRLTFVRLTLLAGG